MIENRPQKPDLGRLTGNFLLTLTRAWRIYKRTIIAPQGSVSGENFFKFQGLRVILLKEGV